MKRIIISLILICALMFCLPACTVVPTNPAVDAATYALLNNLLPENSNRYNIGIYITCANGDRIGESYTATTVDGVRTVEYFIERINSISMDGDTIELPDGYKSVSYGTYDAQTSARAAYDMPKFNFSPEAFENATLSTDMVVLTFKADVISTEAFMGVDLQATDISVAVKYNSTTIEQVTLSYKTENGNTVSVIYTFL